jgi:hypothetical protein
MNQLDWYHDESHVREYRPSVWRRMLAACGLVVESVETFTRHRPLPGAQRSIAPAPQHHLVATAGLFACITSEFQRLQLSMS